MIGSKISSNFQPIETQKRKSESFKNPLQDFLKSAQAIKGIFFPL